MYESANTKFKMLCFTTFTLKLTKWKLLLKCWLRDRLRELNKGKVQSVIHQSGRGRNSWLELVAYESVRKESLIRVYVPGFQRCCYYRHNEIKRDFGVDERSSLIKFNSDDSRLKDMIRRF